MHPRASTASDRAVSAAGDREELDRVRERYASYRRSARKQRAWAADNPGNVAIRAELLDAAWAVLEDGPVAGGVLDAGCGSGFWLRALIERGASPELLHGVELLPQRLAACRSTVPAAVGLRQADIRELPYPDGRFGAVLLFTVLSSLASVADARRALGEATRVVADDGLVLVYEPRLRRPAGSRAIHVPPALIGERLEVVARRPLTVWPPLARRLGRLTGSAYPRLAGRRWATSHHLVVGRPRAGGPRR